MLALWHVNNMDIYRILSDIYITIMTNITSIKPYDAILMLKLLSKLSIIIEEMSRFLNFKDKNLNLIKS